MQAQIASYSLSNYRQKILPITSSDTLQLDTLSIAYQAFTIKTYPEQQIIPSTDYQLFFATATLVWTQKPVSDSIQVSYRVFPENFEKSYAKKDTNLIQAFGLQLLNAPKYQVDKSQQSDIFDLGALHYNGNFGRSLSFGNTQDLVVNSNFNLQMAGKIANDIEILAAITDNNIPLQPEGNTQQIQDFDRIFIQLKKDRSTLLLGDYILERPKSYFMNVNRKLQGIQFSSSILTQKNRNKTSENGFYSTASGAIARGNFNRMAFNGQEGNQGPYKLIGANSEVFIIVLSGTERVYIDGQLLTRGAENDYIISYNTAELTFTDKRLINNNKRIIVEFEYTDQNYLRSLFYVNSTYKNEKWTIKTDIFSEQDAKNQRLVDNGFEDTELAILRSVGDDIETAIVQNFPLMAYDSSRIMYKKIDTLWNNQTYTIFKQSNNRDSANYAPSFRWVGNNQGDYLLSTKKINGRIYEWVAPDSLGNQQGNYALGELLITPQKRQLATVGVDYQLHKNTAIHAELAISNKDVNTFSDIGDKDDAGFAANIGFQSTLHLSKKKQQQFTAYANYEWVQKSFTFLQPYRPVEFTRDWNLNQTIQASSEHIGKAGIRFQQGSIANIGYQFSTFLKENNIYTGYLHSINGSYQRNEWKALFNVRYLSAKDSLTNSQFLRPNFDIAKSFKRLKGWTIGIKGEQEYNQITREATLSPQSFYYNQLETYIGTPDSSLNKWQFHYIKRWDYATENNQFKGNTIGNTFGFNGELSKNIRHQLRWNLSYRTLTVLDTTLTTLRSNNALLGTLTHNLSIKKGFIRLFNEYQLGSGQRQKTEYFYNQVRPDQASYIWIDHNENGEQDLDEFELINDNNRADPNAIYARFILPTNEYERTNTMQFNQNININPKVIWFDKQGFKNLISQFSLQSNWLLRREILADETVFAHYLPSFNLAEDKDAVVVVENQNLRNTLYFKQSKWNVDAYTSQNTRKTLLINGTDKLSKNEQGLNMRYQLHKKFSMQLKSSFTNTINASEAFPNRNYNIDTWQFTPSLTFHPNKKLQCTATYEYKNNKNSLADGLESSLNNRLMSEFRYGSAIKNAITARFSFVNISYTNSLTNDIPTLTSSSYRLLEGLQVGRNYLWTLTFDTRLSRNLLMRFTYDGRKTADNPTNHTGRASIQANF